MVKISLKRKIACYKMLHGILSQIKDLRRLFDKSFRLAHLVSSLFFKVTEICPSNNGTPPLCEFAI